MENKEVEIDFGILEQDKKLYFAVKCFPCNKYILIPYEEVKNMVKEEERNLNKKDFIV
jgi:hypothetical protein